MLLLLLLAALAWTPVGCWEIAHTDGTPIHVRVLADGTCTSDWDQGEQGKWRLEGGKLWLEWSDGWTDVIEEHEGGFRKSAWGPGVPREGPPTNRTRARKTADRP